jgi:hypothetical protein
MLERDQILRRVRDAIEEVARAEHAQFVWRRTSSCTCATVSGACSLAAL